MEKQQGVVLGFGFWLSLRTELWSLVLALALGLKSLLNPLRDSERWTFLAVFKINDINVSQGYRQPLRPIN